MFIVVYLLIFINVGLVNKLKYKVIVKPNLIFTFIWCLCVSLASLGFYGLFPLSTIIHLYTITIIISFNLSYFIVNKGYSYNQSLEKIWDGKIRFKFIYSINFISWIFMSRFIVKSINIIMSGGFRSLRLYAYDSTMGLGTTTELTIAQLIVYPIFDLTILIAMLSLNMKKKKWVLTIIALIDIIIYSISFGGRDMLAKVLIFYLIIFFIRRTNIKAIKVKIDKRMNVFFIGAIVFIFSIMTQARSWVETNVVKEVYYYMVGSFSYLQELIQFDNSNYLYGKAALGFIYNLFCNVATFLFKINYRGSDYQITQVTALPRLISPNDSFNALATMIYPLLRDFGYFGIVFGSAFLAWLLSFVEKKFKESNNTFFFCMYIIMLYIILVSTMNYYLLFPSYGIEIIFLLFFVKSDIIMSKNKTDTAK